MAFVPYVPPTGRKPISPQAQELSNKIGSLIRDYRGYYPSLSDRDVRDALRAAGSGDDDGHGARPRRVGVALAVAMAAMVGVAVAVRATVASDGNGVIAPAFIAIALAAIGIARFLRNR